MRVLLIDASHILRTVFVSSGQERHPDVIGYFDTCLASVKRAIKECQPTHVLFALDDDVHCWRRALVPGYRQDRFALPVGYQEGLLGFRSDLKAEGIASLQVDGMEAKDVIATVSSKVRALPNVSQIILGANKRLFPLIGDHVCLRNHFARYKEDANRDLAWLCAKHGVTPEQWQGVLVLAGDTSSGVPGVPGVGEKTAIEVMQGFDSVDEIQEHLALIEGRPGRLIREHWDTVSKESAIVISLRQDLQLNLNLKDMRYVHPIARPQRDMVDPAAL